MTVDIKYKSFLCALFVSLIIIVSIYAIVVVTNSSFIPRKYYEGSVFFNMYSKK